MVLEQHWEICVLLLDLPLPKNAGGVLRTRHNDWPIVFFVYSCCLLAGFHRSVMLSLWRNIEFLLSIGFELYFSVLGFIVWGKVFEEFSEALLLMLIRFGSRQWWLLNGIYSNIFTLLWQSFLLSIFFVTLACHKVASDQLCQLIEGHIFASCRSLDDIPELDGHGKPRAKVAGCEIRRHDNNRIIWIWWIMRKVLKSGD